MARMTGTLDMMKNDSIRQTGGKEPERKKDFGRKAVEDFVRINDELFKGLRESEKGCQQNKGC
jgi:hypothetical protein